MKNRQILHSITQVGVFAAAALIVFVIENQLPPLFISGIKPGLSNAIVLISLFYLGRKKAFFILLIKVILSSLFCGTAVSFIFSIAGGVCAFVFMAVFSLIFYGKTLFLCSVMGALAHNFAQLVTARFILDTTAVFAYAPYFFLASVIIGVFTGLVSQFTIKKLPKNPQF